MERTEARSMREPGGGDGVLEWHPPLGDRVRAHTSRKVNQRIDGETRLHLERHARGSLLAILRRLASLDREWDLDRVLMVGFAGLGGASAAMSLRETARHARPGPWTAVLGAQLALMAFHAARGWSPPVRLLRRFGFRTRQEIEAERFALERLLDRRLGD